MYHYGALCMKKIQSNHKKQKMEFHKELYHKIDLNKKKMKLERISYLELLSSQLKLPLDLVEGAPIVTAFGKHEVCIENYKGILEYNDTFIKILTKVGNLYVEGNHLTISYFSNEEMKIKGTIQKICYLN